MNRNDIYLGSKLANFASGYNIMNRQHKSTTIFELFIVISQKNISMIVFLYTVRDIIQ